ncbi:MAG: universal stress protein [bacterium]
MEIDMENCSILFLVGATPDPSALDRIVMSARATGMHVSILVVGLVPAVPTYAYGLDAYSVFPFGETWSDDVAATRKTLTDTAKRLGIRLSEEGISGRAGAPCSDVPAGHNTVARMALTTDALLISDDLRGDATLFDAVVKAALFQSPAGLILNAQTAADALTPAWVFIAWNEGLCADRAIHAALPLLSATTEVTIGLFDPVTTEGGSGGVPGSDIGRWLSHRGLTVNVQQYPSGGEEIGTCITGRATETGADLVVMGAYGHARMHEMIFGGTTRSLIEQSKVPVLLAH